MSSIHVLTGAQPPTAAQDPSTSPAEAFFIAFREVTRGIPFTAVPSEPDDLSRVAGACRMAELRAAAWVRWRLGWDTEAARELGRAFVQVTGDWLTAGTGDLDALRRRLQQVWRDGLEDPGA